MNIGIAYALSAYLLWGLLPIYLHLLAGIPTPEILAHRIVWSLATVAILLIGLRRLAWLRAALAAPRTLWRYALTAGLISCNWIIYIWSVNTGHVVDSSLGYFINPLVNVLLGWLLLHERLRRGQKLALALAAIGVVWLTWSAASPPWIGLTLALSFSLYGLLRKTAALGALEGFSVEAGVLAPLALAYLLWVAAHGDLGFLSATWPVRLLLVAAGPVTTVPLLLFAAAARRISFSLLGLLQYLAPTLQWFAGVFVFQEPFASSKVIGFGFVWMALLLYAVEGAWFGWQQQRCAA